MYAYVQPNLIQKLNFQEPKWESDKNVVLQNVNKGSTKGKIMYSDSPKTVSRRIRTTQRYANIIMHNTEKFIGRPRLI